MRFALCQRGILITVTEELGGRQYSNDTPPKKLNVMDKPENRVSFVA
jgi:hypothetical protein